MLRGAQERKFDYTPGQSGRLFRDPDLDIKAGEENGPVEMGRPMGNLSGNMNPLKVDFNYGNKWKYQMLSRG